MGSIATSSIATWSVAGLATFGVIVRPFGWPEAIWASLGAAVLVVLGLLPWAEALRGVAKGGDVYLFLIGMMTLAEAARQEGLFDWIAGLAVRHAQGSERRLFMLIYAVGVLVTTFLSNDATAVVLTPAVYAAAKAAKAEPLPYLFACAFVANAASFVLPISNPANLVVYASHMPPLLDWLRQFGLPSLLAIATTYAVLRIAQRNSLRRPIAIEVKTAPLTSCGKVAGIGIVLTGAVLMWASAASLDLGLPTFLSGLGTIALILMMKSDTGWRLARDVARHISWGVLPLVAGLFVLAEALEQTGLLRLIAEELRRAAITSEAGAVWGAGSIVALTCNLVNNLPAGLLAGAAVSAADVPAKVAGAVLIGVDLGPNLSVTGSLATILWLVSIRREGANVGAWRFLKLGVVIMPPALVLALGALVLTS